MFKKPMIAFGRKVDPPNKENNPKERPNAAAHPPPTQQPPVGFRKQHNCIGAPSRTNSVQSIDDANAAVAPKYPIAGACGFDMSQWESDAKNVIRDFCRLNGLDVGKFFPMDKKKKLGGGAMKEPPNRSGMSLTCDKLSPIFKALESLLGENNFPPQDLINLMKPLGRSFIGQQSAHYWHLYAKAALASGRYNLSVDLLERGAKCKATPIMELQRAYGSVCRRLLEKMNEYKAQIPNGAAPDAFMLDQEAEDGSQNGDIMNRTLDVSDLALQLAEMEPQLEAANEMQDETADGDHPMEQAIGVENNNEHNQTNPISDATFEVHQGDGPNAQQPAQTNDATFEIVQDDLQDEQAGDRANETMTAAPTSDTVVEARAEVEEGGAQPDEQQVEAQLTEQEAGGEDHGNAHSIEEQGDVQATGQHANEVNVQMPTIEATVEDDQGGGEGDVQTAEQQVHAARAMGQEGDGDAEQQPNNADVLGDLATDSAMKTPSRRRAKKNALDEGAIFESSKTTLVLMNKSAKKRSNVAGTSNDQQGNNKVVVTPARRSTRKAAGYDKWLTYRNNVSMSPTDLEGLGVNKENAEFKKNPFLMSDDEDD